MVKVCTVIRVKWFFGEECIKPDSPLPPLIHGCSCEISASCGRWSQESVELQSSSAQFCSAPQLWNQSIQKIAASFLGFEHRGKIWQRLSSLAPLLPFPGKALPEPAALVAEANQGSTVFTPEHDKQFHCYKVSLHVYALLSSPAGEEIRKFTGLQHRHRHRLNAAVKPLHSAYKDILFPGTINMQICQSRQIMCCMLRLLFPSTSCRDGSCKDNRLVKEESGLCRIDHQQSSHHAYWLDLCPIWSKRAWATITSCYLMVRPFF